MRTFHPEQYFYDIVPFEKLNLVLLEKPILIVDLVLSRVSFDTLMMLKMRTFHPEQYFYDIVPFEKLNLVLLEKPILIVDLVLSRVSLETSC